MALLIKREEYLVDHQKYPGPELINTEILQK